MNALARLVPILVAAAVAALLAGAGPAQAHAFLQGAYPGAEATLPAPPVQITLRFSEPVVAADTFVRLLDLRGNLIVQRTVTTGDDPRVAMVAIPALAPGVYIVNWSALSALDGHVETGSYWFRIAAGPAEAGRASLGAGETGQPVSAAEAALKGLGFLSALLLFGVPAVRLVTRIEPGRGERLVLGLAALVQGAYWALVWLGQERLLAPGLGLGPRFLLAGRAMAILSAAYLVHLLAAGAGSGRRGAREGREAGEARDRAGDLPVWPGLVAGGAALAAFSLTGHSAGAASTPVSAVAFDWVHMAAAAVWTGAIALLLTRRGSRPGPAAKGAVLRLTGVVAASAAALALTGLFNAESRGVEVATMLRTGYGLALAWKLGFVALMALLGAFHAFVVNPWRQKGASPRLWRAAVSAEALALLLVLAATSVLTLSAPPAPGQAKAVRERGLTLSAQAGRALVETTLIPNLPGANEVTVRLSGEEIPPVERALVRVAPLDLVAELSPLRGQEGAFAGKLEIPAAPEGGEPAVYSLDVTLIAGAGEEYTARHPFWPIPAPGGTELLRKADEAMGRLSTLRVYETLSDGRNSVDKIWWYKAPDQVYAEVVGGTSKLVIIGVDRWTTSDGETWEHDELARPLDVPGLAYADQAAEVEILGREVIDGAETFVVAFRYANDSYRFVAWIDAATYRLARLTMDGPHHFMTWTFGGFDEEIRIEPPLDEAAKASVHPAEASALM